jgi:hypothetical protein
MRRNRNNSLILLRRRRKKNLIQRCRASHILRRARFTRYPVPKFIILGETGLNCPLGKQVVDIASTRPVIAGVNADTFTEKFFDEGVEGGCGAGEG